MNAKQQKQSLDCAVKAALAAGELMRANLRSKKKIHQEQQHDIKLELDIRCQQLIERKLQSDFPGIAILGEEGITGDPNAEERWVVDPIDGTVNFTYGIPHACVSIALQRRVSEKNPRNNNEAYETCLGVVLDPFCQEIWTAIRGRAALLNGRRIRVSQRPRLNEAIVSMGFAKYTETLEQMLPTFNRLIHRVRKIRIMGAAALSFVYVASGRFDAYIETGVRLWDIAAGGLIVECAGGEFWRRAVAGEYTYEIVTSNGLLGRQLRRHAGG
jgi:myo-inositol-1(or 4)-monophosphatase